MVKTTILPFCSPQKNRQKHQESKLAHSKADWQIMDPRLQRLVMKNKTRRTVPSGNFTLLLNMTIDSGFSH
jgi:hypothetical protein